MKRAVWFSRHTPTPEQLADAERLGYEIMAVEPGKVLGAVDLKDNGDVKAVVSGLLAQVAEQKAVAIFGVPSAPILGQLARTASDRASGLGEGIDGGVPFFASWNIQRSADGGKPTFEHRAWVLVGHLSQASCRWFV